MSKQLTPSQIEELHEYCYFQSVFHYDTQVELVDHLASAIEELWKTNPALLFQDALYKVNQQFGGHAGFVIIRQEKEKALRRKYRNLLWQYVASYYSFPKIMITLSLFLMVFTALQLTENDLWITGLLLTLFVAFSFYFLFYHYPKYVRIKIKKGYSFLLNEITKRGVVAQTLTFSGGFLSMISHTSHLSTLGSIIFSAFVSLFMVILYGDCIFIPNKIHQHFEEQFPQFVIA